MGQRNRTGRVELETGHTSNYQRRFSNEALSPLGDDLIELRYYLKPSHSDILTHYGTAIDKARKL